ncbi:MAG: hypothetical protein ACJ71Z_00035 [Aeromicrobium sp.]
MQLHLRDVVPVQQPVADSDKVDDARTCGKPYEGRGRRHANIIYGWHDERPMKIDARGGEVQVACNGEMDRI